MTSVGDRCKNQRCPKSAPAPSPPPPEPDEWHGWSLGDLRMERDRQLRTYETAQTRSTAYAEQYRAALEVTRQERAALENLDRAIERRKART